MLHLYWQIAIGVVLVLVVIGLVIVFFHYREYRKSSGNTPLTLKFFIAYASFICLLPIILPLIGIFSVFCQLLSVWLFLRHGRRFAGLLEGTDAIHTLDRDDVSKNVGNTLFVVAFKPDGSRSFHDLAREAILRRFAETQLKTPKLWYTCHETVGYSYYLSNGITAEECVRTLEVFEGREELTKEELLLLLSNQASNPLPKDHRALWELKIGTQPVKWKDSPGDCQYFPVVLRIQHCLSDATQLLKGFVRIFGDVKPLDTQKKPKEPSSFNFVKKVLQLIFKPVVFAWKSVESTWKGFYGFLMIPPILLVQGMIKAADRNALHGVPLSGEKHLVFGVEESPFYINAIKKIKNRVYGTAFSEVLLAAISGSFSEYFQKHSKPMPETVAAMVPVFPGSAKLANFLPHHHKVRRMICRNKFSLAVFNLPVRVENSCGQCNAINTRLGLVKEQSRAFKQSIDFRVNYMILSLFVGVLPLSIRKYLSDRYHTTFMVSIIPAPPAISVLGGYPIEDVVFWVPNRGPIGMGFSVFSYDGRFQMGVIVDKGLVPDREDAQAFVDGVFKYLDLLNVETDCSKV